MNILETAFISTPIGVLKIVGSENGVESVQFLDSNEDISEVIPSGLVDVVKQLQEYFKGDRIKFNLKLLPKGTNFQKQVWAELERIPFGQTQSYQQIANTLGDPKVVRAAASANGKNPISILIPCHRVIGSDGALTGYSGGLYRKKWLLEHENPNKQETLF